MNEKQNNNSEIELENKMFGHIQWKGTSVCMDVKCKCGFMGHLDADFTYHIRCPKCKTVYRCNPEIKLEELNSEEERNAFCIVDIPEDEFI